MTYENKILLKQTPPSGGSAAGTLERVKDLSFLIDELGRLNRDDSLLKGAFRLSLLAAMGWSWGAESVAEFSRVDSRCLAAISFDGGTSTVTADTLRLGLQKPSLTMNRTDNSEDRLYKLATRDAYFLQIDGTIHGDFGTYGWLINPNVASSQDAQRTIHAYALLFLNKHFKGEDNHLLDGRS